jgi:hypothetical protein
MSGVKEDLKDFLKSYACQIVEQILTQESPPAIRRTKLGRTAIRRIAHFIGTTRRPKSFLGKSLYATNKGK